MIPLFSNATVAWSEGEILRRESLIREIPALLHEAWRALNPAVWMKRVETPVIVPSEVVAGHVKAGFNLVGPIGKRNLYLRPETTAGTVAMLAKMYPQAPQRVKACPACIWQVGLSFRTEAKPETMRASRLRLMQFYQMEFQLFLRPGTKADFLDAALQVLVRAYGGSIHTAPADDMPHYSTRTVDWQLDGLEVAGCSMRADWPDGDLCEIAIGLDRLVALQMWDVAP